MEPIKRKHEFVQRIWKFIRECEGQTNRDLAFWQAVQNTAEEIAKDFADVDFASDWLISYMRTLDKTEEI